ncbi:hypothetical protein AABB24_005594 [Solanum stoloniferum]|uniref:Uncharacterized protein n=1 Tax=Solanum stoloniferum TaxID=62892 RepID=A0ABD2UXU7_9SOLN
MHCRSFNVRVSNGLGRPMATKYSGSNSIIPYWDTLLAVRNHLAILFTNSKDLQRAVADVAWLLGITMVLSSVIRCCYWRWMARSMGRNDSRTCFTDTATLICTL